jgi:hypothetical protein
MVGEFLDIEEDSARNVFCDIASTCVDRRSDSDGWKRGIKDDDVWIAEAQPARRV